MWEIDLEKLKKLRIKKRWRKVELSRLISNTSTKYPMRYYLIEGGRTDLKVKDLLILSQAFEMSPEELLKEIIRKIDNNVPNNNF